MSLSIVSNFAAAVAHRNLSRTEMEATSFTVEIVFRFACGFGQG